AEHLGFVGSGGGVAGEERGRGGGLPGHVEEVGVGGGVGGLDVEVLAGPVGVVVLAREAPGAEALEQTAGLGLDAAAAVGDEEGEASLVGVLVGGAADVDLAEVA